MKTFTKAMASILSVMMIFLLASCAGQELPEVTPPEWETQAVEEGALRFEIPADWNEVEDASGNGAIVYAPKDADLETGTSNVNIVIIQTNSKKASYDEMETVLKEQYVSQIEAAGIVLATDPVFEKVVCKAGDAIKVSYEVEQQGLEGKMTQMQFFPLVDDYSIVITSTNISDGAQPNPDEVARYMLDTLTIE